MGFTSFRENVVKANQILIFQALKSIGEPASATDLAGIVGLSVNCTCLHMKDMHENGILTMERFRSPGGSGWGYLFSISPDADTSLFDGPEAEAVTSNMQDILEGDRLMRLANLNRGAGYTGLACAILIVAIRDWRSTCRASRRYLASINKVSRLDSLPVFHSLRAEVQDFWNGGDGQLYREMMGCGELDITDIAALPEDQTRPAAWG